MEGVYGYPLKKLREQYEATKMIEGIQYDAEKRFLVNQYDTACFTVIFDQDTQIKCSCKFK